MDKERLLQSARGLRQPSEAAAEEYGAKWKELAGKVTKMLVEREDIDRLIGPGNTAMMVDNHKNHGRFMESLFLSYSPARFIETILWVFRAYGAHGFRLTYWPAQLNAWLEVMHEGLTRETYLQLAPFYEWMLVEQPAFAALSEFEPSAWETQAHQAGSPTT